MPVFVDVAAADPTPYPTDPFDGQPASGVTVVGEGGTPIDPAADYYFGDTDPLLRQQLDLTGIQTATGSNGTAFVIAGASEGLSGVGPAGCTWATFGGAIAEGVFLVQIVEGECL